MSNIDNVRHWITPPECQGQIVMVSYGSDYAGTYYRQVFDRSDNSATYYSAKADDCGCESECNCFDPVNSEPSSQNFNWNLIENQD
jgi:hypothetical protein